MEVNEAARNYNRDGTYTYADYAKWDDDIRCELIDGKVYMMSAPLLTHQRIIGKLFKQIDTFLDGKPCEVLFAPLDVCLNGKGDKDDTVVQPDIIVVCDESILDEKRCNGAPSLVIEVLSPSTSKHDRFTKLSKYMNSGVQEYWTVDPEFNGVTVHILKNGKYTVSAYEDTETIPVNVLKGCKVSLAEVF